MASSVNGGDGVPDRALSELFREMRDQHLSAAVDELNEIVRITEDATNTILEEAEEIDNGGMITDSVARIFEACSFQDITGQRIGKVVAALKQIEDCIDRVSQSFGHAVATSEQTATADSTSSHDDGLLNGPQMPGTANSQADIDALLASFD